MNNFRPQFFGMLAGLFLAVQDNRRGGHCDIFVEVILWKRVL